MEMRQLLRQLMEKKGCSGYEKEAAKAFYGFATEISDEAYVDNIGNVICKVAGSQKDNPLKIMVFAHIDSLGFIINRIDDQGFIFIDRLGGIPEKVLPGLRVSVKTIDDEYLPGVIAVKSHHATSAEEKYKVDKVTDMYVDIGAKSAEEVLRSGVRVGCPIVYEPGYTELLGGRISGTFVDNRAGCAGLLRILHRLNEQRPPSDVYVVASTFEEFNLRGAMMAAKEIKPDFAICIDVSLAGDTPETRNRFSGELGKGPVVCLYNFHGRGTLNGTIAHEGLYKLAVKCAKQLSIPLQEFASVGMLTDNAYVQFENGYVACLDMGFPTRYTHSPVETFDVADLEMLCTLVHNMLQNINSDLKRSRYCID